MLKKIGIILCITVTILASTIFIIWQNGTLFTDLYSIFDYYSLYTVEKENLKENLNQTDYQHVSIYYDDYDTELIPTTKTAIEDAITANELLFHNHVEEPIDLIFISDYELMEEYSGTEYGIGAYVETFDSEFICITPQYIDNDYSLDRQVIMHEYTHYVFAHTVAELGLDVTTDFPLWFNEGMADYVGYGGKEILFEAFEFVPFEKLVTTEQWNENISNLETNEYVQSYLAIKYLIDTFGEDVIIQIINSTESHGDFEEGFEDVTDLDVKELDILIE